MKIKSPVKKNVNDERVSLTTEAFKNAFQSNLFYVLGRFPKVSTINDKYLALAYSVRDRLLDRWVRTSETYYKKHVRTVCYLSAEFLLGPHLGNNLVNLGVWDEVNQAMKELDLDLEKLVRQEEEPGLGNGGLGRLAACYMDSLSTLQIPAIGYGIRYEFGIFNQLIRDGWQVEATDKWLQLGNPWEIPRPEIAFEVKLGGRTEHGTDETGHYRVKWVPNHVVKGIAYDIPILGYMVGNANLLRLWKAEAAESFDFQAFNVGDYYGAVEQKVSSENITKVLYPNDEQLGGKRLRLEQQYFFVSCSIRDMMRIHLQTTDDIKSFHKKYVIQLNDTHPAIAVAELMRLFVDEYSLDWETAWDITKKTCAYTNHTLLPEALEKWPVPLFGSVLPRHLEIIYEINSRFLEEVSAKYPGDKEKLKRLSLIDETGERYVRMAHLACVGSQAINGVAALHTDLLKKTVLCDFYELYPKKFHNVTNGVTPRRWMLLSNPGMTSLITKKIGDTWIRNTNEEIKQLEPFAKDRAFKDEWQKVKIDNKKILTGYIKEWTNIEVNPESLFDIQVKRIHEYKRQHLNILHVVTLYNRLRNNPNLNMTPRTVIFGGKAAPGYFIAKLIIKLINSIGIVINNDPAVGDKLKVVFLPNFNVKNGQHVYPAADLSEQISTAGKEASGTGNMKFAMNGALTIGTLDGANVEIRDAVGKENFFLFGLTTDEVAELKTRGYNPRDYYESNTELHSAIDLISSGHFSNGDRNLFKPLIDSMLYHDEYMLFADYEPYIKCQDRVSKTFCNQSNWTSMSILNVARMGMFSSDRAIKEYCDEIWHAKPQPVKIS
jgi:starch phosphorylase